MRQQYITQNDIEVEDSPLHCSVSGIRTYAEFVRSKVDQFSHSI